MSFILSTPELLQKLENIHFPYPQSKSINNQKTLLIGGSGFLGIHLLDQLLSVFTNLNHYTVLVRSDSIENAKEKLIQRAKKYHLNNLVNYLETFGIDCILGDVEQLNWGLNIEVDFENIIYMPSKMSALATLSQLWASNIQPLLSYPTKKLFFKNFFYLSSLSVFVSSSYKGICYEDDFLDEPRQYFGGYSQSKFLAEKILTQYATTGNNIFIIRPGLLTGSTLTGLNPANDFFSHFIKALKQIQYYPSIIPDEKVDISPINLVSEKIVDLFLMHTQTHTTTGHHKNFHIANSSSLGLKDLLLIIEPDLKLKMNSEHFYKNLSSLDKTSQLLLKMTFEKNKVLDKNFKYYNFDLFQSTSWQYQVSSFLRFNAKMDMNQIILNYIKNINTL